MKALRRAAFLILAAGLATAAQAQAPGRPAAPAKPAGPRQEKPFPLGASWVATSLNGRPFGGDRPSFTLNQQYRATGFGGCNNYAATAYPLREQGFAVGPFALTKKQCGRDAMAVESAFLVALRSSAKWEVQGSQLIIRTQSGGELRFERAL
jgi:heat shock protein HslJ